MTYRPAYYQANRDRIREGMAASYRRRVARDPNYVRKHKLKYRYGLTAEQYEALVAAQKGCCALCLLPADRLVIDHDHKTGNVRALLCSPCNAALGFIENNAWLADARTYLEKHRGS